MRKTGLIILAVAIPIAIAVAALYTGSDQVPEGHHLQANETQLSIIRELCGTDVTVGEVLERVFPEVLEDMPDYLAERMYATTMEWPTTDMNDPQSASNGSLTLTAEGSTPDIEGDLDIIMAILASFITHSLDRER